jgi:hypothetical protein
MKAFYFYLNNFTYIHYLLIIVGIYGWIRYKLDKKSLIVIISLILLNYINLIIHYDILVLPGVSVAGDTYRFKYQMHFISFILMGIGIYAIFDFIRGLFKGKKVIRITTNLLGIFLISSLVLTSVYGGFPRLNSEGPYIGGKLRYVSDNDFRAIQFIKDIESNKNVDYYILADGFTCTAAFYEIGYRTLKASSGNKFRFCSLRPHVGEPESLWLNATINPSIKPLKRVKEITGANTVYIILSKRLGEKRVLNIVDAYKNILGDPIYEESESIYVFKYISKQ